MNILQLKVSEAEYKQILEEGQTEFIVPITEETQDRFVTITPHEVTLKLYDKIMITHNKRKLDVQVEYIELDYEPDDEGFIPLYENEKGKICISDANMVYFLGTRKEINM